ncbi:MAG TPA: efflux RND transporter permease subunit, partial [Methanoculleus sp.]|nr:efflux RND transporter permease subunit [Methanoculleus sp.]
ATGEDRAHVVAAEKGVPAGFCHVGHRVSRLERNELHAAAILGTKEMIVSITASVLTTVCVFVPMVLLRSNLEMLGEILTPMAATIIISLLASLVVSVTLVPVLTSSYVRLYTRKQKPLKIRLLRFIDDKAEAAFDALDRAYKRTLALLIDYKWLTLILVVMILVLTFQAFQAMPQSLYPTMSETSVTLSVTLPEGTTLATTESILMDLYAKAEQDIKGYKDITVTAGGGGMFGGGMFGNGGMNSGSLQISLLDEEGADTMQIVQDKLRRYFNLYPAASFSFSQMSMGLGNLNPVDVAVKSDNLDLAMETAEKIRDLIDENLKGITEIRTDFNKGLPELKITIDRNGHTPTT